MGRDLRGRSPPQRGLSKLGRDCYRIPRAHQIKQTVSKDRLFGIEVRSGQIKSIGVNSDLLDGTDRTQSPLRWGSGLMNKDRAIGPIAKRIGDRLIDVVALRLLFVFYFGHDAMATWAPAKHDVWLRGRVIPIVK